MSREDRLRVRLRSRLRGRLWFPSVSVPSRGFPCVQAGFRWGALFDISMSAGEIPVARPLTGDPLWPVPPQSLGALGVLPWAARRFALAVRTLLGLLVTCRCVCWVPLAYRVVASRRCLVAPSPLAVLARRPLALPAPAGWSCAALPSLSRRLAGRWCNGRRRAASPRARGGAL